MILNKIGADKLKGRTVDIELGAGNLIVGPNFSGKTEIIDAITFLFTGKFPGVKKEFWPETRAWGEFDDGSVLQRTINAKGTVTIEDGAALADKLDLPLMHRDHYFGLTDAQRTDYVFERIRLPEVYSIESIWADLKRLDLSERHSEAVEIAQREMLTDMSKFFGSGAVVQAALGEALESLREKFTYWNRRAKETQGAVATLTELRVRSDKVKAAPANLESDIEAAQKELERLNSEKGRVTAKRDEVERNAGRRKQLQKSLDADRTDYARMLERKQAEKAALEKQLVPEPDAKEIETTRRTIATATQTINGADSDVETLDKVIGEVDKRLKEIAHLKACPYCKAKGMSWKKTLEAELRERKTNSEQIIRAATKRRDSANETLKDATETLETLLQAQESNHRLREQIRQIEREIGTIRITQSAESEKRARWADEIKDLSVDGDAQELANEIAMLEQRRGAAATKLSELHGRKQEETRIQQDLLRAMEAEKEHQDAKAHVLIIKAIAEFLKQKREAIICEAFTKLLQVANQVVQGILKSPLALHENTIGRFEGAKFVAHHWFSGTEKALTYIAIAVALSAGAPIKLVLLDEFGRLDAANQVSMLERLLILLDVKVIDQFIVVSTHEPALMRSSQLLKPELVEGGMMKLIKLGK